MNLLPAINGPEDIKKLGIKELEALAAEVRRLIIDTVSKNGGHLASSLGVVELTIALHYVFNAPQDKIVWDVGHQSYAHKIMTGRRDAFSTLRQYGGLSGFPKREESPYDAFDVGHSSTSISAALGLAQARCINRQTHKVVAVIGDGSLMAGMAFEGLNNAGHLKKDLIVILNDNEMSISPNVGALSSSLSRLISGQTYNKFREEVKTILQGIPAVGKSVYRVARQSEDFFKSLFVPGLLFDELGFKYFGPVLGHRIDLLIDDLTNIRKLNGPVLLHVVTRKGRGYLPAETNPTYFHGVGPFDRETGKPAAGTKPVSYTKVFGDTLTTLASRNEKVVAITAGMTSGTGLEQFQETFPDRFYDVGIAEQHAITFAAGMAAEGLRPVAAIYSTFLQRSYDQILHDVCMQNLPVIFMLDRAGIVGEDGPTHHGLFDISYLRNLPNMVFMVPRDENELQHMLYTALSIDRPVAIRYPRGAGVGVERAADMELFPIGKAELLRTGSDVAVFAVGPSVYAAAEAADRLSAEGVQCAVVDSRFVKPLDERCLCEQARKAEALITVEENMLQGGFGSAVLEALHDNNVLIPVRRIGLPDKFIEHGSQKILRQRYGLDAQGIYAAVKKLLADGLITRGRKKETAAG